MKKILLTAAISAMLVIGTAITSFADTYDPQYPLKGYMESWFVEVPVSGTISGITLWKSNSDRLFYEDFDTWSSSNSGDYVLDLAIKNKDPRFLNCFSGLNLEVIAKLTDYQTTGLGPGTPADEERYTSEIDRINFRKFINSYDWKAVNDEYNDQVDHLATEIRNFLNSFDWRNASDFEKAVQIARRITKADYLNEGETQSAYSCLVNGTTVCAGYTSAALLLAACVDLPADCIMPTMNHIYPVFLVDGVWLAYEPTSKDDTFNVAEVWTKTIWGQMQGTEEYQPLGRYCKATGYEIPTIESVEAMYPGRISVGYIRGERAAFIRFLNENSSSYEYVKRTWNLPY